MRPRKAGERDSQEGRDSPLSETLWALTCGVLQNSSFLFHLEVSFLQWSQVWSPKEDCFQDMTFICVLLDGQGADVSTDQETGYVFLI